jgi:hypothetical protein
VWTGETGAGGVLKNLFVIVALISMPIHAFSAGIPECFVGRWQSNEALTLEDMRKHPEVTEKARAIFEKMLFGSLVLVFGPGYGGWYLEGEQTRADISFEKFDVMERGTNWVTLRTHILGVENHQQWFCESGRIYTLVSKWEFREYFSPLP